jgi:membrane-bound ClpP family serine protease
MNRNTVWPVLLIVLGVVLLAHNLGLIHFAQLRAIIGTWWPVALIIIGVAALVPKKGK